jgi:hypothetical protein
MTPYNIALLAHIGGVLVLFMAIAVEWVCLQRLRRAESTEQLREWASLTKTIAKPLPLSMLAILASGIYMSVLRSWEWSIDWIGLSLLAALIMVAVGASVNSRRMEAIARAAETAPAGVIAPDLRRQIHDPVLLTSVQTLATLTFGVVFLKVIRPDPVEAVIALGIAVAIGLLSAQVGSRARRVSYEGTTGAGLEAGH